MPDQYEVINFMRQYSFATLVSIQNNVPVATHLPFVVKEDMGKVTLLSHLAKANSQAREIEDQEVLVIFTEPHAYISPSNYEEQQNVPTWNYISIHAYGKLNIIADAEQSFLMLEEMINTYEAAYLKQWENLPAEYKDRMLKGIVPFELQVTKLEGKKKLSQNRSIPEKESIINNLSKSVSEVEKTIAAFMSANENLKNAAINSSGSSDKKTSDSL